MLTKIYPPELHSTNLDTDWFYRRGIKSVIVWGSQNTIAFNKICYGLASKSVSELIDNVKQLSAEPGILSRTPALGSSVAWISALLLIMLVLILY